MKKILSAISVTALLFSILCISVGAVESGEFDSKNYYYRARNEALEEYNSGKFGDEVFYLSDRTLYVYSKNDYAVFKRNGVPVAVWYGLDGRCKERILTDDEYNNFVSDIEEIDADKLPDWDYDWVDDGGDNDYVHISNDTRAAVYMNNPDYDGRKDGSNQVYISLIETFKKLFETKAMETYYDIDGAELLINGENHCVRSVYKNGDDFRVLIKDKENSTYNHEKMEWHSFDGNVIGDVVDEPDGFTIEKEGDDIPENDYTGRHLQNYQWQVKWNDYNVRALTLKGSGIFEQGLYLSKAGEEPILIVSGTYATPVVVPNTDFAVCAEAPNGWQNPNKLIKVNLKTSEKTDISTPENTEDINPVVYINDKLLLSWKSINGEYGYYMYDISTDTMERVEGDFGCLLFLKGRDLQATSFPNKYYVQNDQHTVGVFDSETYKFTELAKSPVMIYDNDYLWVDEQNSKMYIVVNDDLISLPITINMSDNNSDISVILNGKRIEFDVAPIIQNDRVLVPIRAVSEALGFTVEYMDTAVSDFKYSNSEQLITPIKQGKFINVEKVLNNRKLSIQMTIDETTMIKTTDNKQSEIELDVPACIVNDRTLVPLRAVSEAFDCNVEWDGETRTVTITSSAEATPIPTVQTFEKNLLSKMPDDRNYMVSPFSLKMALAMAANAADGETKSEILNVLDIDDLDAYNAQSKELLETLAENAGKEGMPVFEIANSIWLKEDYKDGRFKNVKFNSDFKNIISENFKGTSDIVNDDNKLDKINGWVKEKTHDKIESIIEADSDFLAALINAVYMKAQWQNQFSESATYKEPFTDRNGNKTDIDFMHETAYYSYYGDETAQLIEIPYKGNLSMYIVLGDGSRFYEMKQKTKRKRVALSMPKFKIESTFDNMGDIVKDMGVNLAFSPMSAQFPNMFDPSPEYVWIDDIIQKTYIDVDEKGTEAAAVTAIMVGAAGSIIPDEPIEFKAYKPFTYFICDNNDNTYFMGEYAVAEN